MKTSGRARQTAQLGLAVGELTRSFVQLEAAAQKDNRRRWRGAAGIVAFVV